MRSDEEAATDGLLTIPRTPGSGKKPHQRKQKRGERTVTFLLSGRAGLIWTLVMMMILCRRLFILYTFILYYFLSTVSNNNKSTLLLTINLLAYNLK